MSIERADASLDDESQGDQWNRLTDLGVATVIGARLIRGCEIIEGSPVIPRQSVGQEGGGRRGRRERQPAERYLDPNWTVETKPLDGSQIKLNNERAVALTLSCLIIRAREAVKQCGGDEVQAMIRIRAMLKQRNDERTAKRLPPYQITPSELLRRASQENMPVEEGPVDPKGAVQDALF